MVGGTLSKRLTRRWEGTVEVDGVAWPQDHWLAVAAGTVEQIGLSFKPFRYVEDNPGHLHAIGLGCSISRFAFELPLIFNKRPLRSGENTEIPAQRMVLSGPEPMSYMLDGDFHRAGKTLTIEVGPAVDILVP